MHLLGQNPGYFNALHFWFYITIGQTRQAILGLKHSDCGSDTMTYLFGKGFAP